MARMKRISRSDLMDEFLESQGLHRKHIARDASCLFRAVSEQVYCTQSTHSQIRKATVNYMKKHRQDYEHLINEDFVEYLNKLKELKVLAGKVEMSVISKLLNICFIIFEEIGKLPSRISASSCSTKEVLLCCSYDQHYDSVYPRSCLADAAFCQAIVYEVLYKRVFRMGDEANHAVEKMLHDKNYIRQRRTNLTSSLRLSDHIEDGNPEEEVREAIEQGIPPFPFKVAKALDPNIYRNVEFDVWNEMRKDQVRIEMNGTTEFQPGDKCLVVVDKEKDNWHIGHIQEMNPNRGPVTVFVEELGEKCTVPYENLEVFHSSRESGKAKGYKGRKIRDFNFSVGINTGTFQCRSPTHLTFKTVGRYQRNFSVHPTFYSIRPNAKNTSLQSNDSEGSKEESFEASNDAPLNESANDTEIPYHGYCQSQYCSNDYCLVHSQTFQTSQPEESEPPAESYPKQSSVVDTDSAESATGGSPPYYVGTQIDPSMQYSSQMVNRCVPYAAPNSVQDPAYAINHNACRSNDVNGNDLPMSDINTLRFFYNLGLDYYRISVQSQTYPMCAYNQSIPIFQSPHEQPLHPAGNYACASSQINQHIPAAATFIYGHPPVPANAPPSQAHPTPMFVYPAPGTANTQLISYPPNV